MPGTTAADPPAPPFAPSGLDHVVLLVSGMEAATAFYVDVLGCTIERALPAFAMVQLRAGASLIDLVDIAVPAGGWARPGRAGGRNMDHVCIAIDRFEEAALRTHLAAHGVAIVEEGLRYGAAGEGPSFYVRDPSGNQIELKGPPPA